MRWNYLSITKVQRWNRWSLGMYEQFHPTLYWLCAYLYMMGIKLIHVSKGATSGHAYCICRIWSSKLVDVAVRFHPGHHSPWHSIHHSRHVVQNQAVRLTMMTSSNGNIFRGTGHLCEEFPGPRRIPHTRQVTWSFDVCFHLRLNKRLNKQS